MREQPSGSQGIDPSYSGQMRRAATGKHHLKKSGSGTNFLQYGLVAGFISMAILSTFSSVSDKIAGLLVTVLTSLQGVSSVL
jgi:Flp pilus assembly pilin Flp